jgi:hypothetical protein
MIGTTREKTLVYTPQVGDTPLKALAEQVHVVEAALHSLAHIGIDGRIDCDAVGYRVGALASLLAEQLSAVYVALAKLAEGERDETF